MTYGNILVTGAAGFIGSHVVDRLLAHGWHVQGLDNFGGSHASARAAIDAREANLGQALSHPEFRLVEGDVRDAGLLADLFRDGGFHAVVHMAARAGARPSIQAPEEYYDCNLIGTLRVLEAMNRFGVRSLVFASSSSVYGGKEGDRPTREDDEGVDRPLSPYAATKRACELLCHTYWHLYGMRCCVLRFFPVYGPRQRPDLEIHELARSISSGKPITVYGDGRAERDLTYVDDAVDAVERAVDHVAHQPKGAGYEVLNVGGKESATLNRLVELLSELMGATPEVRYLAPRSADAPGGRADITRARELLQYEPKVTLAEGLRRFVAWFWSTQGVGLSAGFGP